MSKTGFNNYPDSAVALALLEGMAGKIERSLDATRLAEVLFYEPLPDEVADSPSYRVYVRDDNGLYYSLELTVGGMVDPEEETA